MRFLFDVFNIENQIIGQVVAEWGDGLVSQDRIPLGRHRYMTVNCPLSDDIFTERDLVLRANIFAAIRHFKRVDPNTGEVGHKRKYTGDPYIVHPEEVSLIVKTVPGYTPEMVAASYLHDTKEDCGVTDEELREEFGDEVADLVGWLSDVSKPEDGKRKVRKQIDRAHSAAAPANAQSIKVADAISNSFTIGKYDPDFARVWFDEKELLLLVLTKADPRLLRVAHIVLVEGQRQIVHNALRP